MAIVPAEKGKFVEEEIEGDKSMKGIVATRVQKEVTIYTLHTRPPPSKFIATTGGGASGVTNAPSITTGEIKVDPQAQYSGAHAPGVWTWPK